MADQKLTLAIETKADTAGVTTAVTAVQSMDAAMQKLEQDAPEVAEALKKVQAATEQLGDKAAAGGKKVDELSSTQTKGAAGHRDSGRAVLEASRALEDLQYGIGGVLNNLPGLVQMLGMGAGLAGVISIVAVGITQLAKHVDFSKDKIGELGLEAGAATAGLAKHSEETARMSESQATAAKTTETLKEQIALEDAAMQRSLTAMDAASKATDALEERKRLLLKAEQDLAVARIQADPTLSELDKIKQTNDVTMDYSARAQAEEQKSLERQRREAEEKAKFHEANQKRLAEQAAAATQAERVQQEVEARQRAAQQQRAQAERAIAQELANLGNEARFTKEPGLVEGLDEKAKPGTNALVARANISERMDALKVNLDTASRLSPGGEYETKLKAQISEAEAMRDRFMAASIQLASSQTAEGQYATAKSQAEATVAGLGSPKAIAGKADSEGVAAAAARAQAAALRVEAGDRNRLFEMQRETQSLANQTAVTSAEEAAANKSQNEDRAGAKNVDSAMTKARALARNLQPESAGAKALNNAASREDVDALIEIVNTLFEAQSTTKEELQKGVRKEIENLRNQVRNMRRNDKS